MQRSNERWIFRCLTPGVAWLLAGAGMAHAGVIYVDDSAPIGGNGQAWATAFRSLQDGLSAARAGDEIRIGQGAYCPDRSDLTPLGTGNRNVSFVLKTGVTLTGGYAGTGFADPDARNVSTYPAVLSGDLLGNDGPNGANMSENSIHVIVASGVGANTIVDGVRIASGFANATPIAFQQFGAGVLSIGGDPSFRQCVFENNRANSNGGAMYSENGDPTFDACEFRNNAAISATAIAQTRGTVSFTLCTFASNIALPSNGDGGAIRAMLVRDIRISGCTFDANSATRGGALYATECGGSIDHSNFTNNGNTIGGALWLTRSSLSIESCAFTGNFAAEGGAIALYDADPRIVNCQFQANAVTASPFNGGALHIDSGASPTVIDCTFQNNAAIYGAAVCIDGHVNAPAVPVFFRCTFINNDGLNGAMYSESAYQQVLECQFWDTDSEFGALRSQGGIPVINCCLFQNNRATTRGGAVGNSTGSHARIAHCSFVNNTALVEGGAMFNTESNVVIASCEFRGNSGANRGGAMINDRSDVQCSNSAFIANTATQGGAVYNYESSDSQFSGCTFVNNVSPSGSVLRSATSVCTVTNSIAWFNSSAPFVAVSGSITVNRCDLQSAWSGPGANNFTADPLLVNVNPGFGPIDVSLTPASPCIDAGFTPADASCRADLKGNVRAIDDPNTVDTGTGPGNVMDIGAVEFGSIGVIDCNSNAVPDTCDFVSGLALDCNTNGIPDLCDILNGSDCNNNRVPDECETDCNHNGSPDACDIQVGASPDCNANGVPDECEPDCDGNHVPDTCDLSGGAADCNHNNILDACEIAAGTVLDCDGNGVPDECQADCNNNDVPDVCDIAAGSSADLNGNGIPDECEPDCNDNNIPDFIEIQNGSAQDCNDNHVIDACEIASGAEYDCNGNGLIDVCEILAGLVDDCNHNNRPDQCDLLNAPVVQYILDDGFPEDLRGNPAGGGLIWMNQFVVVAGGETVDAVQITIGYVPVGEPFTVCVWSDPNGDGNPLDAQLLVAAAKNAWGAGLIYPSHIPIPPTYIGPAGTKFFVGAHIVHAASTPPAALDRTAPHQHRSWFAYGSNIVNLAANPTPPANIDLVATGDWQIRASSGSTIDVNGDGVPDACRPCPADIAPAVGNGRVDVADLLAVITAWGSCSAPCPPRCDADFVPFPGGDCAVGVSELLQVIGSWGACP